MDDEAGEDTSAKGGMRKMIRAGTSFKKTKKKKQQSQRRKPVGDKAEAEAGVSKLRREKTVKKKDIENKDAGQQQDDDVSIDSNKTGCINRPSSFKRLAGLVRRISSKKKRNKSKVEAAAVADPGSLLEELAEGENVLEKIEAILEIVKRSGNQEMADQVCVIIHHPEQIV